MKPNWISIALTSLLMIISVVLFHQNKNEQAEIVMAAALGILLPQPIMRRNKNEQEIDSGP